MSAVIESHGISLESHSQVSHPSGSEPTYEERKPKKKMRRRKRRRNRINPIHIPSMFTTETSSNGGDQASLDRKSSFLSSDARQNSIPSSVVSSSSVPIGYLHRMQQHGAMNPAYIEDDDEFDGMEVENIEDELDIEERPASQITVRSSDTEAMSMGRCDSQATVRSSDSEAMSVKWCSSQSTVRSSDTDAMSVQDFVLPSQNPSPVPIIMEKEKRSKDTGKSLGDSAKFFKPIHVPRGEITSYIPQFTAVQATTTYSMFNVGPAKMSGMPDVEVPMWHPKFPMQATRHQKGKSKKSSNVNVNNNNLDLECGLPGSVMEMTDIKKPIVIRPKRHVRKSSPKPQSPVNIIKSAFTPVMPYPKTIMVKPKHQSDSPELSPHSPPARNSKASGTSKNRPGSPRPESLTRSGFKYDAKNPLSLITPRRHGRKSRKVNPLVDESEA